MLELQRQNERERELRRQQERSPDVRLESPAEDVDRRLVLGESPCFPISRIGLEVAGAVAGEDFAWALPAAERAGDEIDPATGRCLGSQGINLVMRRVQNAIVARGYITSRVLAPSQDLNTGDLRLVVVPGRIREIRLADGSDVARARLGNALPVEAGDLLNLRDLEQGLENFKRVPTAEADIRIEAAEGDGARPGDSDLVVAWRQSFPFRLNLSVDDGGTKATGKYLAGATISYDHALTLNDLLYFSVNRSIGGGEAGPRGTGGATFHYSLPLGYWQLGMTLSQNRYHQTVAGLNQDYRYSGDSANSEIRLSRLVYRDAVRKTTFGMRLWGRSSANYVDDVEVEIQRRRMAGWGIDVAHREFIGSATLDALIDFKKGTGAFGSLPAPEAQAGDATSRPRIVSAQLNLSAPFVVAGQRFRYGALWRGQWGDTPLVPQDRFAIAGRYTVRGFDGETLLSADNGWLWRNDLGWAIPTIAAELYLGADYGQVSGKHSQYLPGTRLAGAVVGLRGALGGLGYDLFFGKPLHKPEGFRTHDNVAGFNLNWSF